MPSTSHAPSRLLVAAVSVLVLGATMAGCQNARAGARCNTRALAQQGDVVLKCVNGRWQQATTKAKLVQVLQTLAAAKAAATPNAGPALGAGGGSTGHFGTVAPGAALPDDATCASRVRPAPEVRARNVVRNHTPGAQKNLTQPYPDFARVTGNFVGTTDEIIQWTACKWGIDEDIIRAQAASESWWDQNAVGDFQSDPAICVPGHGIGVDGRPGQCPASGGLLALTYQYYQGGFPEAMNSTAYNLDYVYAWWHACYNGEITWLNSVEHVGTYGAGDAWGCVGTWFSGRWHTAAAEGYITRTRNYLAQQVWTTPGFLGS